MAKIDEKIKAFDRAKILVLILFLGILFLGNRLREFSYASVPNPGEVADEYSFGWLGLSLLKEGYPVAWSGLPAYQDHDFQKINVDGIFDVQPDRPAFSIDKPWFDHPPLFGLITGGYAYLKGAREYVDASVILLRRPLLKISLITTVLIFLLASRWFNSTTALLASLLYSVIPTTVISSRLALAENGYVPLFLGSLYLADIYISKKKNVYWIMAVLAASGALLFKLSAVAILITLFFIALVFGKRKKKNLLKTVIIGLGVSLLAFGLYGAFYDWQTFVNVIFANTQRFYGAGAEIFLQAVAQSRFTTTKFLTDGWVLAGWISLFVLAHAGWKKERGVTIITLATLSYFVTFILFGGESYGWYKIPFYPFLVMSLAVLLKRLYEKPNLFIFSALLLLPFGSSVHRLLGIHQFQQYAIYLRIFSLVLLFLFGISLTQNKKKLLWQRIFILLSTILVIWLSIRLVFFYTIDQWYFVT